jgi:hypothetical protein
MAFLEIWKSFTTKNNAVSLSLPPSFHRHQLSLPELCRGRDIYTKYMSCNYSYMIEGSLEVKLPTIWRDGEESEEKRSEERRCRCAKR